MLRRQLGDEDFFQSLRDYVNDPDLRYDNAHSDDFKAVCEEVSGQDLGSFFDQWLYRTTLPVLDVTWDNFQISGLDFVKVQVKQVQEPGLYLGSAPYNIPVDFLLSGNGANQTFTVTSDQRDKTFIFPVSAPVETLYLDPDRWLLHRTGKDEISAVPDLQGPVRLMPAYPNPFNPRCLFRWETAVPTSDLVEVFDMKGARILAVPRKEMGAGPREFLWTGLDDQGHATPSGTYLYRVTCRDANNEWRVQGKVTLAR
jgi:hypothetical protein